MYASKKNLNFWANFPSFRTWTRFLWGYHPTTEIYQQLLKGNLVKRKMLGHRSDEIATASETLGLLQMWTRLVLSGRVCKIQQWKVDVWVILLVKLWQQEQCSVHLLREKRRNSYSHNIKHPAVSVPSRVSYCNKPRLLHCIRSPIVCNTFTTSHPYCPWFILVAVWDEAWQ